MTEKKMKISELAADIERVMADPATKVWVKGGRNYYFLRDFPTDHLDAANRCMAIIQTILGYNVKRVVFKGRLWLLVAPGIQKNALKSFKSQKEEVESI